MLRLGLDATPRIGRMASQNGRGERSVKRRIAATAATAAIALSGPATAAARPASPRTLPTRPAGDPVARLANSDQSQAALSLDVSRRAEMANHRRRLAGALAAELGDGDAATIERALATADAELSDAYRAASGRGSSPGCPRRWPTAPGSATRSSPPRSSRCRRTPWRGSPVAELTGAAPGESGL